jgi:CBS domain-containing protein
MIIKEILPPNPVVCTADTYLQEVVQTMTRNNLFCIPVVESLVHKNPIGVVTEKSICRRSIAEGLNPLKLTAGRVMNSDYRKVTPGASLENCHRIMESCNLRYLVVADENNVCRGIITFDEIYKKITKPNSFFPLNKFSNYPEQIPNVDRIF